MNINEASELLSINPETLRKWDKHFNLNISRNKKGHREYNQEDINTLMAIKQLRDLDNGIQTINRKLNPGCIQDVNSENSYKESVSSINESQIVSKLDLIGSELVSRLDYKLDAIVSLAQEHSKATYTIGKLEAEKFSLEDKLKLICDSNNKDISSLQKEIEKMKLDNENQQEKLYRENNQLKAELEEERKKPWYKKIFRS